MRTNEVLEGGNWAWMCVQIWCKYLLFQIHQAEEPAQQLKQKLVSTRMMAIDG